MPTTVTSTDPAPSISTPILTTPPTTTSATVTFSSPTPTSTVPSPPPAAFSAGFDGVTGSSTCRDFLAAPEDVQHQAAVNIALAENNGQAAGDPFIVQNTEYSCGFELDTELAYVMETIG